MATYKFAGQFLDALLATPIALLPLQAVTVKKLDATNATLYTSRLKAATASNPATTDSSGNLSFFADPGQYNLSVTVGSTTTTTLVTVPVDPQEANPDRRYHINAYGGDPTGATYSDTALAALLVDVNAIDPYVSPTSGGYIGALIEFDSGVYKFASHFPSDRANTIVGKGGLFRNGQPTVLLFDDGTDMVVVNNHATSADGGSGAGTVIRDMCVKAAGQASGTHHAINMKARATTHDVFIYGASGNGYEIYGDVGVSAYYNANGWRVFGGGVEACLGKALHAQGNDANAGVCVGLDVRHCGWMLYDESFLGNYYFGYQGASNTVGIVVTGSSNATQLYGPYAEGGQAHTLSVGVGVHGGYLADDPTYVSGTYLIGNRGLGNVIGTALVIKSLSNLSAALEIYSPKGALTNRAINGAVLIGTPTLTGTFSPALSMADIGRTITVAGAGAAGALLTTTISAIDTSTATPGITLAANASTTVSGATVQVRLPGQNMLTIRNEAGTAFSGIDGNGWVGLGTASPTAPLDVRRALSGDAINVAGKLLVAAGDSTSIALTANNSTQSAARIKRYTAASAGALANALSLETLAANANILIRPNGTGSASLGASGGSVGFFGSTGTTLPTAYTQTYLTATRTHSNPTAATVATTASTITTPYGYTTQAQADAIITAINALVVDVANVKGVLNSVIDDGQAFGLLQ